MKTIGRGVLDPRLREDDSGVRVATSLSLRAQRNPSLRLPRHGLLRGACHPAALCADRVARNDGQGASPFLSSQRDREAVSKGEGHAGSLSIIADKTGLETRADRMSHFAMQQNHKLSPC